MESQQKICCITGNRVKGFPWQYDYDPANIYDYTFQSQISRFIEKMITEEGYNYFICGGALGVDITFALEVISLRDFHYPNIQLEIAVPCPKQDKKWGETEKSLYREVIQLADTVTLVSDHYNDFCFHKRNEYMVNKSNHVFVVWNGETKGGTYYTYQYAKRKGKEITVLKLQDVIKEADEVERQNKEWQISKYGKPLPPLETIDDIKKFCDEYGIKPVKDEPYEQSPALRHALDQIETVQKRREKYYKNRREIP